MQDSNPSKSVHMTKQATFDYVKNYIKEIQLIDHTIRKIPELSRLHPVQPISLMTMVAIRPYSVNFCGRYAEHWELSLN